MNTKLLMTTSATFLGVLGIILSFLPHETMDYFAMGTEKFTVQFLKLLGSFYLAFAMLNWMAKGNLMGGIYSKPVAVGNFMHFAISAISLVKMAFRSETHFAVILIVTILYVIFAFAFGYVFMHNPKKIEKS